MSAMVATRLSSHLTPKMTDHAFPRGNARGNPAPIDRGMQLLADAFFKIQPIGWLAVCLNFDKHFWPEIICAYRRAASRTRERDTALSDKLKQSGMNFRVSWSIWKVDVRADLLSYPVQLFQYVFFFWPFRCFCRFPYLQVLYVSTTI
jgi:hypothetical protein